MSHGKSLSALILEHFEKHPYKELAHDDWVDLITARYRSIHGRTPRDPWRAARKLHQDGKLQKISNGVYKYDPYLVYDPKLEEFTQQQKDAIFMRDDYRCVICGKGREDGVDIQVDHIIPKDKGGRAIIDNGQTLCAQHNFLKKNMNATESGKRLFIRLRGIAKHEGNEHMAAFTREILEIYDRYDVNGHIQWKP